MDLINLSQDESIEVDIQNKNKEIMDLESEMNNLQSIQALEIQNEQSDSARLCYNIDSEIQQLEIRKEELLKNNDECVQLLKEADEKKEELNEKINLLIEKINVKNDLSERSIIQASHDGKLTYTDDLKQRDAVQQQQQLGFIFTEDNQTNTKYVEAFISEADRNKVQIGNEVKVYLNGINEAKFKFITGKIETISNSLKKDEITGNYFYAMGISIKQDYLRSTKEAIQLNQSMPTISYVVYEKESLLDWFLKQLNFRKV